MKEKYLDQVRILTDLELELYHGPSALAHTYTVENFLKQNKTVIYYFLVLFICQSYKDKILSVLTT